MKKQAKIRMTKIAPHSNRTYSLVSYDTAWPKQFAAKSKILKQIFGNKALTIEHIGSTSVPGMVAKPQVDILIVVPDLALVASYYEQMQQAGFTARGDYVGEGEEYFTEDTADGIRLTSIHVLPNGHVWVKDMLNFRDYLRTHPAEVVRYSGVKKAAMTEYPGDYDAYYKNKVPVVQELRQKAADWALLQSANTGTIRSAKS